MSRHLEWLKEEVQELLLQDKLNGINYFDYKRLKEDIWAKIVQDEFEEYTEEDMTEYYGEGYDAGVEDSKNIHKTLKPEKVVVPEYVAKWLEAHEDDSIYEVINILHQYITEIDDWYIRNTEKLIEAKRRGHEVEEKSLYVVRMPKTECYLTYSDNEWFFEETLFREEEMYIGKQRFTEEELKELNPIYWDIAKPDTN